jgi:hypothetical protein
MYHTDATRERKMDEPKANYPSTPDWLQANPSYNATEDAAPMSDREDENNHTASTFLQRLQKVAGITSLLLSPAAVKVYLVEGWEVRVRGLTRVETFSAAQCSRPDST